MNKPIISIKLRPTNYAGQVNLGNRLIASLTGNGNFITILPTLVTVQAAITDVENAIAVWGPKGNRGNHADLVDLRNKTAVLARLIKSLSQYVQNTAQIAAGADYEAMAAIILTSGFQLANVKSPQGVLEMPQGFHNFVSRRLAPNQVKMKWKKPLNTTSAGNVKSYRVLMGTTAVFSAATEIGTTTKTSFVDTNTTAAAQIRSYWVVPVNSAGDGVPTAVVTVTVAAV